MIDQPALPCTQQSQTAFGQPEQQPDRSSGIHLQARDFQATMAIWQCAQILLLMHTSGWENVPERDSFREASDAPAGPIQLAWLDRWMWLDATMTALWMMMMMRSPVVREWLAAPQVVCHTHSLESVANL